MKEPPWSKFAVCEPSINLSWPNSDCMPLESVGHVAHVRDALRIVEDAKLYANLVSDESRPNTQRIRVVWLLPNDWSNAGGFRYGNVRFSFDWKPLVANKRAYWVESIAYKTEACRILITDTNYDKDLQPYNPRRERGPWWVSPDGVHYWNNNCCLEVMYEGDLILDQTTDVDLVNHHHRMCSIDYRTCPDMGRDKTDAATEFIGTLVSKNQRLFLPGFVTKTGRTPQPAFALLQAYSELYSRCGRLKPQGWGPLRACDPYAPAVARALLRSLAAKELVLDAEPLASIFQNIEEARLAIGDLIADAVGLAGGEVFIQYEKQFY
jgi:hypothetical protein